MPTKTDSWSVQFNFDESVQFAIYIAKKLEMSPLMNVSVVEPLHVLWQEWWKQLLTQTIQQVAIDLEQLTPKPTPDNQLQEIARRINTVYDPPRFSHHASTPLLQAVCREQWPMFHEWWSVTGGEKARLTSQLSTQIQHLKLSKLVNSCAKNAKKSTIKPFRLIVELVYWPTDYNIQLSPSLLLLGSQYIQKAHLNLLKERLSNAISGLIH